MVDAIISGKSIEGTVWIGAEAAEDDNYGDEITSVKENGEAPFSDGGPNNEEVRDEELPERGSNEEEVLDGVKLASASDSKVQEVSLFSDEIEIPTYKRLKALDCPQVEAETIQADEQHRQCEGMEYEETREVTEAVAGQDANVEEDVVKVNDENGKLKMLVGDLFKKNKLQNKLIKNLTRRISQLEEQISKSKRKKTRDKKKKMKETENSTTGRRKTECPLDHHPTLRGE